MYTIKQNEPEGWKKAFQVLKGADHVSWFCWLDDAESYVDNLRGVGEEGRITLSQAKWAQQHDWCLKAIRNRSGLWVILVADDELTQGSRVFEDFKQLKAWAGY
jgi:hypothetical protein